MNTALPSPTAVAPATRVRYGVLALACSLAMITYLDRVCFGMIMKYIQLEFELGPGAEGWLYGAFALAYSLFEVPSGALGDLFGPRKTLIRIVLWWSLFTALTGLIWPVASLPWFAFTAMLTVRFLFGMGEAGAFPNLSRALFNWFPFSERGFTQGAVWMAGRLGGGLTPFIVSLLLVVTFDGQGREHVTWRHVCWIFGGLGVGWCLVFWWFFRDRPEQHPAVNAAELAWIRGPADAPRVGHSHAGVPWGKIVTNRNLWCLCLMYFCGSYGWYFNITYLPKYLREVYGVDRGETWSLEFWRFSLLAGAPLLLGAFACLTGGMLTDAFIRRTGDRKWGRRLFGVCGHGACAVCYFLSMLAGNVYLFVLGIALAAFCNDLTMGSTWASSLDIGRKYAGIVSGCMNMIGNLGGFVAGVATGQVLEFFANDRALAWHINFLSYSGVYVVAVGLWLCFDSTKPVVRENE